MRSTLLPGVIAITFLTVVLLNNLAVYGQAEIAATAGKEETVTEITTAGTVTSISSTTSPVIHTTEANGTTTTDTPFYGSTWAMVMLCIVIFLLIALSFYAIYKCYLKK